MSATSSSPFAARRARIAAAMREAGGGVAIVPTAPERQRNSDNDHPYRHGSDFHYLTGFAEPGAWLVIGSDGRTTLVCRPKDVERELWDGIRLGPDAAPAALGVDDAVALDRLDEIDGRAPRRPARGLVELRHARPRRAHRRLARARSRAGAAWASRRRGVQHDLAPLLATMRVRKDAGEIETMRRAATISAAAHVRAMRFCAARFAARSARRDPRVRDRGRAAARVPPLGRRGTGLRLDRRRRRQRLHPPLHAGRDAAEGRRALPDRRRLRARRLRQRRDAHLSRRRPLQRGAARALRHRRGGAGRRRRGDAARARACATPTPPRCASSRRACSTPACSTATSSATSTR